MKSSIKIVGVILCIAFAYTSCKHELPAGADPNNPANTPSTSSACSADSVYFQNAILPVIVSNCAMSGCHNTASHKEGIILETYTGVMSLVRSGNPSGSKLVEIITTSSNSDIMPPPPMARLSTTQINDIKKWISQGAKNNMCNSCDTSSFTFTLAIKPIMQNKCMGCHTGVSASANIDLSTHAGVKAAAQSGRLMGSVKHLNGYSAMPPGGIKMPDCEITQLQKWIDAGMLNN